MAAYYRDGWFDALTGLPLTDAELLAMRDAFLDRVAAEFRALVDLLGDGEPEQFITWPALNIDRFADAFTAKIREVATRAYASLSGGTIDRISDRGWETIAGVLDRQSSFVAGFLSDIRGGGLSKAQVAARAELYTGVATQVWEQARADEQAPGLVLPQFPGDGGTPCGGRCRCHWDIDETATEWRCTWVAQDDSGTCEGCQANASAWSPLVVRKDGAE